MVLVEYYNVINDNPVQKSQIDLANGNFRIEFFFQSLAHFCTNKSLYWRNVRQYNNGKVGQDQSPYNPAEDVLNSSQ